MKMPYCQRPLPSGPQGAAVSPPTLHRATPTLHRATPTTPEATPTSVSLLAMTSLPFTQRGGWLGGFSLALRGPCRGPSSTLRPSSHPVSPPHASRSSLSSPKGSLPFQKPFGALLPPKDSTQFHTHFHPLPNRRRPPSPLARLGFPLTHAVLEISPTEHLWPRGAAAGPSRGLGPGPRGWGWRARCCADPGVLGGGGLLAHQLPAPQASSRPCCPATSGLHPEAAVPSFPMTASRCTSHPFNPPTPSPTPLHPP